MHEPLYIPAYLPAYLLAYVAGWLALGYRLPGSHSLALSFLEGFSQDETHRSLLFTPLPPAISKPHRSSG